jgi:hypothetical protein
MERERRYGERKKVWREKEGMERERRYGEAYTGTKAKARHSQGGPEATTPLVIQTIG